MNNAHDERQTNGATVRVAVGIVAAAAVLGAILWAIGDAPPDDDRRIGAPPSSAPASREGVTTSRVAPSAATATATATPQPSPATFGAIKGRVVWKGVAPKLREIDMTGRETRCVADGAPPMTEEHTIIGDDGGLQNVIVSIKSGPPTQLSTPVPTAPVVLDQVGCRYVPHALAWRAGQPLELRNSDLFGHSVHSDCVLNPGGNETLEAAGGPSITKLQMMPEVYRYRCEVHPWMLAYVGVFAHPFFAVTGADGRFAWADVPTGECVIEAKHEKWGAVTAKCRVTSQGAADVTLTVEDN